jgi:hypothetical protein
MNDRWDNALFEPELILPAQMPRGARLDGNTSGARALMLAVLEEAVLCIERGRRRRHPRTRRLAAEAETWVRSDCREWLFSFASICDVLGIDPEALRTRLLTRAERPASAGCAARAAAGDASTRSGAVPRGPLRGQGGRAWVAAVATARVSAAHHGGSRGTGADFGAAAVAWCTSSQLR